MSASARIALLTCALASSRGHVLVAHATHRTYARPARTASMLITLPMASPEPELDHFLLGSEDDLAVVMVVKAECDAAAKITRWFADTLEGRAAQNMASRAACYRGCILTLGSTETEELAEALGWRARSPYVVTFDRGGRIMDFVAETKGALLYGLREAGAVADASAEPSVSFF